VNSTPIAVPFVIKAIGDPDALESALKMPGGPADAAGLFITDMIQISKEKEITVPAFKGSTRMNLAVPFGETRPAADSSMTGED